MTETRPDVVTRSHRLPPILGGGLAAPLARTDRRVVVPPVVLELVASICERRGSTVADVFGHPRSHYPEVVAIRHDVLEALWSSGYAASEIGRFVGLDHSTVLVAIKKRRVA